MKNPIKFSKKLLIIPLLLCFVLGVSSISLAYIEPDEKILIDSKLTQVYSKTESYSEAKQQRFYKFFIQELSKKISSENRGILNYIMLDIESRIVLNTVSGHNSLILKFTAGGDHSSVIEQKKVHISNLPSVFIFRSGKPNLSALEIQTITSQIKALNKEILIFIDQEGGAVNRYLDFSTSQDIQNLFDDIFAKNLLSNLNPSEQILVRNIFPQGSGYFPSLGTIGVQYDKFGTDDSKQTFIDVIAYLRLQSLHNVGINTYGLVADLNLGNPAISLTERSFSRHEDKYIKFIDSFIDASEKTGVFLYLKHFPGHGAGKIDSHQEILDLTNSSEYLQNNIAVFEYFLDNKRNSGGLMVGHIVFDPSLEALFSRVIKKSDFLLTDDLAMQGFKKLEYNSGETLSFSTNIILKQANIIKVDTQYVESVY